MRTKEEKVIRNIRQYAKWRKLIMLLLVGVVTFMIWCTVLTHSYEIRLDDKITAKHVRSMASFENPKHELPILFSRFYTLSACRAKLMMGAFFFAGMTGFLIALFLLEIIGAFNGRYLILSMWERIEKLEAEISRLQSPSDTDDQHPHADDAQQTTTEE